MRLFTFFLIAGCSVAQDSSPRKLIASLDGKDLFAAYCASCHGMEGKGNGPVAAALKKGVPDITTITKRNKGVYPADKLQPMILGEGKLAAAHGSREMPVWGPLFRPVENDKDFGMVRARNLVEYIRTLQVK
jgi:mono/diheme cytochrome c family protein